MAKSFEPRATILLAEDEPGILYTFKAILEEEGFKVLPAESFEAARKSMLRNQYDAVITDFSLEKEDLGLKLAREAKKRTPSPVVLIYSDYPTVDRLRAAHALPVDYFAFKPVDLDEIKKALSRLVARRAESLAFSLS
ncbi:MAG TPA: response regulator [Terriglobales bacterium]|nr:response regulator [Terriglobales bacterium]